MVNGDKIISMVSTNAAPIKRMIQNARDEGRAVDATCGRRTRTVLVMESGHLVLSALTTETIEYDGYTVVHKYGKEYNEGVYGWYNGVFKDVKPYFESVDEYSLYIDGRYLIGPTDSLAGLDCKWIVAGDQSYYERVIDGCHVYYSFDGSSYSTDFSQSVSILTTDRYDVTERYLEY